MSKQSNYSATVAKPINGIALSEEQKQAAEHSEGTRAVIATAGAGKTTTLARRVASLILDHGIAEKDILATTFTNAAANELKSKIDKTTGRETAIQCATIHGFCLELVMKFHKLLGFESSPMVLRPSHQYDIVKNIALNETKQSTKSILESIKRQGTEDADSVAAYIEDIAEIQIRKISDDPFDSNPKFLLQTSVKADNQLKRKTISQQSQKIFEAYQKELIEVNVIDYDSILFKALELLVSHNESVKASLPRFVFIDEAQDLSSVQWLIINQLSANAVSTDIIGDDDQSIYGWRGARPEKFVEWANQADKKIFLTTNRRCRKQIVQLASSIVENIEPSRRLAKDLRPERKDDAKIKVLALDSINRYDQIPVLIKKIHEEQNIAYKEIAIICRNTTRLYSLLEQGFIAHDVPYVLRGGANLFEKSEFKFLLALLFLVKQKKKTPASFWRPILGAVGVSAGRADTLSRKWANGGGLGEIWDDIESSRLSVDKKSNLLSTISIIRQFKAKKSPTLGEFISDDRLKVVLTNVAYYRHDASRKAKERKTAKKKRDFSPNLTDQEIKNEMLKLAHASVAVLWKNLNRFKKLSLSQAVFRLSESEKLSATKDAVVVTTVHRAKGLEWSVVYVAEANDSSWPAPLAAKTKKTLPAALHQDVDDEEKRLMYVALTRAKEWLFLVSAASHIAKTNGVFEQKEHDLSLFLPQAIRSVFSKLKDIVLSANKTDKAAESVSHLIDSPGTNAVIRRRSS